MTAWSNDVPAHAMTWVSLLLLGETTKTFPRAGPTKMRSLQFWAGTADLRAARARVTAIQLTQLFREMFGAKREPGSTQARALADLLPLLLEADRTIEDLADACNEHFLFMGETS